MSYSTKLESYVSLDELVSAYRSVCNTDGYEAMKDKIWHRVMEKCPDAGRRRWEEIYLELRRQLACDYAVNVKVTITKKEEKDKAS